MDHEVEDKGLNILVAVKAFPFSESAVRLAVSIVQSSGGRITLLATEPNRASFFKPEKYLERYQAMIHPYPVAFCVRKGDPNEEFSKEASSNNYDLAILGERPENLLLKYIFSRRAEKVLNRISCPILIAGQRGRSLRRFLVCEGGKSTKLLPTLTGKLAPLTRTAEKVLVLHVMSQISAAPSVDSWELTAEVNDLIQKHTPEGDQLNFDLSALHAIGVNAAVRVRHGVVVEEIESTAEEEDIDVIVMGAPRASGWQRYLLDSPIHEIVLNNQRAVLLVG